MKINFEILKEKYYFYSLAIATLIYFLGIRLFQDWFYHFKGWDRRPEGLFASFGPQFFRAEPLEVYLYLLAYLIVPVLAYFLSPIINLISAKQVNWRLVITGLVTIFFAGLFFVWPKIPFDFLQNYLQENGISHALWLLTTKRLFVVYMVLSVSVLFFVWACWLGRFELAFLSSERLEKFLKKSWPLLIIVLAVFIFHPNYPVDSHHYNYFLGAVNDVSLGKPVLYETSHLYGLFDIYFLVLLFKFVPLTYSVFALVIMISFFLFFLGIFAFLRLWLSSYTLATLGLGVSFAIIYLFQTSPTRSALFFPNMSPFRLGFYIIALFLVLAFQRTRQAKWRQLLFLLSSIALFWNFDSGLFLSVAVLATLGFLELSEGKGIISIFWLFGNFLLYVAGVFAAVNLVNFFAYGSFPNWPLFFRETKYFAQGAGMYPLPVAGIYQIFFVVYLLVLLTALSRITRRSSRFDLPLLFLAIFGAFSLIYYIGESTWQLLYVVTIPFILITFYAIQHYAEHKIVRVGFATLLVFSGLLLVFKLPVELAHRDYAEAKARLTSITPEDWPIYEDAQYIKEHFSDKRIPLMARINDDNDTKLLIFAEKANYFDFYYTFTIYFEEEMQRYVEQVLKEKPSEIFIGREQNDQIKYFLSGISQVYKAESSLQTLDIYVIKN